MIATVGTGFKGLLTKGFASAVTTIIGQGGLFAFLTADIGQLIGTGSTAVIGTTIGSAIAGSLLGWLAGNAIGKKVGALLFPDEKEAYENFKWLGEGGFFDTLAQDWSTAFLPITDGIKAIGKAISDTFSGIASWLDTNVFSPISMMASDLWNGITSIFSNVYSWVNTYVVQPIANLFTDITTRIGQLFEGAWIIIKATWQIASGWFNATVVQPVSTIFTNLTNAISQFFKNAWNGIKSVWQLVSSWFSSTIFNPLKNMFSILGTNIYNFLKNAWINTKVVWNVATSWFTNTIINPLSNAFKTVTNAIGEFFSNLWANIKKGATSLANGIIGLFESAVNGIIIGINGFLSIFNGVANAASKITGDDWSGVKLIPTITLARYENGGFPNQGSLFVAGETYGQTEWIGNINGRTGVVSPSEITGIADAIYQTSAEEMSMLRQQVNLLSGISTNDIGKAARSYGRDYYNRTGNNAYVF